MPDILFKPIFAFLLFFSCLAYGSVTALPLTVIESLVSLIILIWLIGMVYKGKISIVKTSLLLYSFLFLSLIIFQIIPLPIGLIRLISLNTANLYDNLMPSDATKAFFTLSIYPNATIQELFKLLTYLGIFFFIINQVENKKQLEHIINTIIILGLVISVFGIIQKYTYQDRVYWFDPKGTASVPFGPFVNRNNFAGYINMIIPLGIGYFLANTSLSKRIICGFSVGVMSIALFLSLSRAGILVYISVLLFMLLFSALKDSLRSKAKYLSIWIFIVVCLFIFFTDPQSIGKRLMTLFKKETFVVLGHGYSWLDILKIVGDFPLFGTGLGTFGNISSMYKTSGSPSLFIYAHNDYLQMLSEVGLFGFILVSVFFVSYFNSVIKTWLKRHDAYVVCLALGGIASIFGMLIYSFLDFNLHIPANAVLFFIILGLVYRLAHTRFGDASILR